MLILDDILLAPLRGVVWLGREVQKAYGKELVARKDAITTQLSEIYMLLETGQMTDEEFEAKESELLDQLEIMEKNQQPDEEEEEEDLEDEVDKDLDWGKDWDEESN